MNKKKIAKYKASSLASTIIAAAVVCAAVSCSNNNSVMASNSKNENNDLTTLSIKNVNANSNDDYQIAYGKTITLVANTKNTAVNANITYD